MNGKLKQPKLQPYIDWLQRNDNYGMYSYRYDQKSCELLDELFILLESIAPAHENGARALWFTAERGTLEESWDIDEMIENGEVETEEEAQEMWGWMFPNEIEWYSFGAYEDKSTGYRAIFVSQRCVIVQDEKREMNAWEDDISVFAQWLVDSVKECIRMLEDGTYNDYVEKNLPPQHRTGTILRKDFWDVWTEEREDFFKDISSEDVSEFIELASNQAENCDSFDKYLPHMTANDFFNYCTMGYKACNYECGDKSPKELYIKFADGRDEGLTEIDGDSEKAFLEWLHDSEHYGGHPWEVCRGGNSTHIDMGVHHDENGFSLYLVGKAWTRTVEIAHFYLALTRAGVPVFLFDAKALADRMAEKEYIGIVPDGVTPRYCESRFPDEDIISFMNLPDEDREQLLPFCHWQPIKPVYLINDSK